MSPTIQRAQMHGLGQDLHGDAIEVVTTRRRTRHGHPLAIVHTTTNLPSADLVHLGPIPCVGVARTFLMVAAPVPEVSVEEILRRRQRLGRTESWLEPTFLDLLDAAGLPLPLVQQRIGRNGSFVALTYDELVGDPARVLMDVAEALTALRGAYGGVG